MITDNQNSIPASYLILLRDNKILLLRRINTGYEDGQYSFIAGHVEAGESFTQCIIREAEEEAGIKLKQEELNVIHVMHRDSRLYKNNQRVDVFFTSSTWDGEIINNEPHKCNDLSWFDVDDLPKDIIPYIREVINSVRNRIFYSEYGWLE